MLKIRGVRVLAMTNTFDPPPPLGGFRAPSLRPNIYSQGINGLWPGWVGKVGSLC